ncbi:MAG: hypothetical protein CHACPFDD_00917 [Phycisphaerae bacterium]|nr:hypothetical protein [Phycisphaerae bacterium]
MSAANGLALRESVCAEDEARVRRLVAGTGFFHAEEVEVAAELVRERVSRGPASGYHFVLALHDGELAGYACYGPIACTRSSYDLYWIAVDPGWQSRGVGRWLMDQAERRIAQAGGTRVYVETSSRAQYEPTRRFYERCGYAVDARLVDFYAPGDDKVVFVKVVAAAG